MRIDQCWISMRQRPHIFAVRVFKSENSKINPKEIMGKLQKFYSDLYHANGGQFTNTKSNTNPFLENGSTTVTKLHGITKKIAKVN